jgi:serine/threonine protein kinase
LKVFHDHELQEAFACRELAATRLTMSCPFVHPVLGFTRDEKGNPGLIYSYGGPTLGEALKNKTIKQEVRLRVCAELVRAFAFLHGNCKVLHLDVKSNNLLYDVRSVTVRLIDFGLAQPIGCAENKYFQNKDRTRKEWQGPEYLTARYFTAKTDIYALGMLFLDVLAPLEEGFHKKTPFPGCIAPLHGKYVEQVVLACLARTPADRPTCASLLAEFDGPFP